MKKYILFLLLSIASFGQTSTGQEQEFPYGILVPVSVLQVPSTTTWIGTFGSTGVPGKVAPQNISIPQIPVSYVPTSATIGGHLAGIDGKLNTVVATTAGQTTRVWFTADVTVVSATNYYATGTTKGTAASAIQNVVNNDGEKKYFAQDVIGLPAGTNVMFPPGTYAGNLSASTSPNSAQQRWTVEIYKCNTSGTPIASGVTGAAVGSLGVTVVTILDSGLLTLADGSVTNVQVSGNLGGTGLSVLAGERIRYHVSAEKVGTAGANITQSVYYGTSYNSFIDVPVPLNTNSVVNLSAVAGATTTDALNTLNSKIPTTYSKIVYVNNANPNSATIFDLNNPPTTNDNALKIDTANLYIGTDASTWVYSGSVYVTKTVPETSNFYVNGTTVDAGNTKTSPINRPSPISVMEVGNVGSSMWKNTFSMWRYVGGIGKYVNLYWDNITATYDIQLPNKTAGVETLAMISDVNLKANLASPAFTGTPTAPTATAGTNTTQIATTAYADAIKILTVRKISTNTTLANSDNGTVILLTASCTVTLPNGLMSGFNCSFSTATGATLTYALGGSVTLINNVGTTMAQNLSHTIVNTGTANEYLCAGSL